MRLHANSVNLCWTDSTLLIPSTVKGDHTTLQYSKWGLTREQYKRIVILWSLNSFEKRRINPKTLIAIDVTLLMWSLKHILSLISTPKSAIDPTTYNWKPPRWYKQFNVEIFFLWNRIATHLSFFSWSSFSRHQVLKLFRSLWSPIRIKWTMRGTYSSNEHGTIGIIYRSAEPQNY